MRLLSIVFVLFVFLSYGQEGYWQQEVNYKIDVSLNDKNHELNGFETFEYINNSPDTLTFLYIHLWPNAYKNNETALARQLYENGELDFYYSKPEERGYIDKIEFKIDNKLASWSLDSKHIDIAKLELNEPLLPGGKISVSTPFFVKIPKGIYSRLGHMGESYQVTQWYPKPAVYDKNGWHQMPYLTQGEFYSEYGSFDVSITLPKNYVLGATGDLVDGEQELAWLEEKVKLTEAKQSYDKDMAFPASSTETKTLRFKQSNVHDFAWFADKRYHVLKGEVELPHSKEKVTTWAMFTNSEADLWLKSIEYLNDAVYYYSLWNGDYPYKHCTAVDGALSAGAGMEYPNITVIGQSGSDFMLETVIMHEVGHNWFYGILGSNERDHPWMDEGLNSFNENRYIETKHPDADIVEGTGMSSILKMFDMDQYLHKEQYYSGYQIGARKNLDQPIEFHSADYTYVNYGAIVYGKSAISFDYLMAYLGEETMDKAMHRYFDTWKFKHPQPEDLRKIIEEESGKDLSWFFEDMIKTTKKLDYKIVTSNYNETEKNYEVKVKNTGDISGPFSISLVAEDSVLHTQWFNGFDKTNTISVSSESPIKGQLRIDHSLDMPENKRKNNTLKTKGLFKKCEPLKLQMIGSIENPDRTQLYWSPIIGWNNNDKAMFGLAFYNAFLPQKRFEYAIAPMYSIGSNEPVGSGFINYNMLPKSGPFRQISIGISGQRYNTSRTDSHVSNFAKIAPVVNIYFDKNRARSPINHQLSIIGNTIYEFADRCPSGDCPPSLTIDGSSFVSYKSYQTKFYPKLVYSFRNNKTLNPYGINATVEGSNDFAKLNLEANYQFDFKKDGKEVAIRFFAGSYLFNNTNHPRYNYRMDGKYGMYDYTYDNVLLDRSRYNAVLGQQFGMGDGGFKMPTLGVGQSNSWLIAMNIKADLPIGIPIGFFIDAGYGYNNSASLNYDFGIHLPLMQNVFEMYFPLFWSDDIDAAIDANGTRYGDLIRFTLHLENINPFQLLRDFEF